jgi:hypothetical protein
MRKPNGGAAMKTLRTTRGWRVEEAVKSALAAVLVAGCTTVARTNARVAPGIDLTASGTAVAFLPPGTGSAPDTDEVKTYLNGEVDLHYSWLTEDQQGWSVGLKVPVVYLFAAVVDVYRQLPCKSSCAQGLGMELTPALPGGYYSFTYFSRRTFATLTLRVSTTARLDFLRVNPQLAFGVSAYADAFAFLGYQRLLGESFPLQGYFDDVAGSPEQSDKREHWVELGMGVRF